MLCTNTASADPGLGTAFSIGPAADAAPMQHANRRDRARDKRVVFWNFIIFTFLSIYF
jgi:hypothetical protein